MVQRRSGPEVLHPHTSTAQQRPLPEEAASPQHTSTQLPTFVLEVVHDHERARKASNASSRLRQGVHVHAPPDHRSCPRPPLPPSEAHTLAWWPPPPPLVREVRGNQEQPLQYVLEVVHDQERVRKASNASSRLRQGVQVHALPDHHRCS